MSIVSTSLVHDESGASVLELALIAPILGFLLLGSVDMAMGYSERLGLAQAANRTIEMAVSRGPVNSSYSYLQDVAASTSGEPTNHVTVDNWLACDNVRQATYDDVCGGNQQTARYVSVRIIGTHRPIINYSGLVAQSGNSDSSSVGIAGSAVVRVQ